VVLDPSDQGGNLLISNYFAVLGLIAVFAEYSKQNACSLLVVPWFESGILRLRTVQCCKRFIFMLVTERRPMAGEHCGLRPPDELVGLALAFCLLSLPSLPRYLLASVLGLARLLFASTRLRALALTCSLRALARPLFLAEFFLLLSDLLPRRSRASAMSLSSAEFSAGVFSTTRIFSSCSDVYCGRRSRIFSMC
jgi:hypothetical protein